MLNKNYLHTQAPEALHQTTANIKTRFYPTSNEELFLLAFLDELTVIRNKDLKNRFSLGEDHSKDDWANRKREITALTNSRYAGDITQQNNNEYLLSKRNRSQTIKNIQGQIAELNRRLALDIQSPGKKNRTGGYKNKAQWFNASRSLNALKHRLDALKRPMSPIIKGGRSLIQSNDFSLSWQKNWKDKRRFSKFAGESGTIGGGFNVYLTPNKKLHIKQFNGSLFTLETAILFPYREKDISESVISKRSMGYEISYISNKWYLNVTITLIKIPMIKTVPVVAGLDMNVDHIAAYKLDHLGNPMGNPKHFYYDLTSKTAGQADALLRQVVTRITHWAKDKHINQLYIERLKFNSNKYSGKGRWFNKMVSQFPTAIFNQELTNSCTKNNILLSQVNPAYTSIQGTKYWSTWASKLSRHDTASIVIGRRGLNLRAYRKENQGFKSTRMIDANLPIPPVCSEVYLCDNIFAQSVVMVN